MTIEEFLKKVNQDRIKREERMTRRLLAEYRRLDRALTNAYRKEGETGRKGEGETGRKGDGENHPGAEGPPLARHEGSSEGLAKRRRLKGLLDKVRAEVGKFGRQASAIIAQGQQDEIEYQKKSARKLLQLLGIERAKIPPSGPENAPGTMGDGSKLTDYFSKKLAGLAADRVRQAASNSAAAKPKGVLKKLKASHGILLSRALTAARTETMRAARQAAHDIYRENGITEWTWHAQLSPTSCAFCLSRHGTLHPISEPLLSHPRCRCIAKPVGAGLGRTEAERVERRYNEITRFGHAVQRHGAEITWQQLHDRAVLGYDPMTGSRVDGVHGGDHPPTRHATRFETRAAFVKAEETVRASQEFRDEITAASREGRMYAPVKTITLERIFGAGYLSQVSGVMRRGSFNAPTGWDPTDFTDGVIISLFKLDGDEWKLYTMYPGVKP
jgi:hypothetical protein